MSKSTSLKGVMDRIARTVMSRAGIGKHERHAHDPWGRKRGYQGSIITHQDQVAKIETEGYYSKNSINTNVYKIDKFKILEHNHGRYIRTNNRIEKLRK